MTSYRKSVKCKACKVEQARHLMVRIEHETGDTWYCSAHTPKRPITRAELLTIDKPWHSTRTGMPCGVTAKDAHHEYECNRSRVLRDFLERRHEGPLPL